MARFAEHVSVNSMGCATYTMYSSLISGAWPWVQLGGLRIPYHMEGSLEVVTGVAVEAIGEKRRRRVASSSERCGDCRWRI